MLTSSSILNLRLWNLEQSQYKEKAKYVSTNCKINIFYILRQICKMFEIVPTTVIKVGNEGDEALWLV